MKVTVFGANGNIGRLVVEILLKKDFKVKAFIHKNNKLSKNINLSIYIGDIYDKKSVQEAISGSDIVISTLGSWGTKHKNVLTIGMQNIIPAMQKHQIKKIITLTGADAKTSNDNSSFLSNVTHKFISLSPAKKILSDGETHIRMLENSSLNWTVLRSPVMTNLSKNTNYKFTDKRPLPWSTINREAVAKSIVDIIETNEFSRKAPYIIND